VGPSAIKFRCGVGRKFGEETMGNGGLAYVVYESWKVAFVVLAVVSSGLMVL
jgi:hypothetical protein